MQNIRACAILEKSVLMFYLLKNKKDIKKFIKLKKQNSDKICNLHNRCPFDFEIWKPRMDIEPSLQGCYCKYKKEYENKSWLLILHETWILLNF